MSTSRSDGPDDDGLDLAAAEYVLGVLTAAERAAAARRIEREAAFAADVASWESRLGSMVLRSPDAAPPPRVWSAIAAEIAPRAAPKRAAVVRSSLWDSLALWRGVSLGASALAAASLALTLLPKGPPPAPAPPPVAIVRLEAPKGGGVLFVAALDQARHKLIVTPVGKAPAGKTPELWLMPEKGAPAALGVFSGLNALSAEAPAALASDSLLGVSLEPLGGSPSGAPTGPVIAVGRLMRS